MCKGYGVGCKISFFCSYGEVEGEGDPRCEVGIEKYWKWIEWGSDRWKVDGCVCLARVSSLCLT